MLHCGAEASYVSVRIHVHSLVVQSRANICSLFSEAKLS